jgi:hypothetical protein
MKHKLLTAATLFGCGVLSACGGGYRGAYYVQYGPPAPRYAVMGVAPGPGYVWTSGWWDWRGNNWSWVEGRWVRPPRPRAVWVAPEWRRDGRGYRFHRGYWR